MTKACPCDYVVHMLQKFLFFQEILIYLNRLIQSLEIALKMPIVKTIYEMSELINNDSFLKSQIVQTHINNNGYFELIPRIGNQRIIFEDLKICREKI